AELALAYWAADQHDQGIRIARSLTTSHPTYAGAHLILGRMLAARGQHAAARTHLERCIALDPKGPEGRRAESAVEQLLSSPRKRNEK
ncbi:MAG: tetratricopeptide repeat protein, partial [Pseudomonadota bacterium]